jgi:hypothetical protein
MQTSDPKIIKNVILKKELVIEFVPIKLFINTIPEK